MKLEKYRKTFNPEQKIKNSEMTKEAAQQATSQQPPKTEIILQHDMSLSILTACILAHLNNIAEPGTFNTLLTKEK